MLDWLTAKDLFPLGFGALLRLSLTAFLTHTRTSVLIPLFIYSLADRPTFTFLSVLRATERSSTEGLQHMQKFQIYWTWHIPRQRVRLRDMGDTFGAKKSAGIAVLG